MRGKVVHITSVHSPFDTRILERECRSLAVAGYDVVVVAPHPRDESAAGVRVRGVPPVTSRLDRIVGTTRSILRAALDEQADVYHFHDPELIPVGLQLKFRGHTVIYDAHEDTPRDIRTKDYLPHGVREGLAAAAAVTEWAASRVLDAVVAATPAIAQRFPSAKAVTVQNFPRLENFSVARTPYAHRKPVFAYVGLVTERRGGVQMIEAMELLVGGRAATLVLAGQISPSPFEQRLRAMPQWRHVDYRGWCDFATIGELLGETRAGLVLLHPTQAHQEGYPVKMFEYMAAGIPVIAADFPLWRGIIEPAGAGLLVDPLDSHAIAAALRWVLDNPDEAEAMGMRGREAVLKRYNWAVEEQKLLALYERLRQTDGVN